MHYKTYVMYTKIFKGLCLNPDWFYLVIKISLQLTDTLKGDFIFPGKILVKLPKKLSKKGTSN